MSYTVSATGSYTYSLVDVEIVVRRFTADIVMIAQSSGAISETKAREYAHDVEVLAKEGYLRKVDLTLLSNATEVCATQYTVHTSSGDLVMSRPGGLMWPRVANAFLRIVLSYTDSYTTAARERMRELLNINWQSTNADTSHATLRPSGGRGYASNAFGMQRRDFAA
jgi:hypothetical protein